MAASSSPPTNPRLLNQELDITTNLEAAGTKDPFLKRILIVDDDTDVTLTFAVGLENYNPNDNNNKVK
jgi:hypothetical protein